MRFQAGTRTIGLAGFIVLKPSLPRCSLRLKPLA
jgi:hypothetical protein